MGRVHSAGNLHAQHTFRPQQCRTRLLGQLPPQEGHLCLCFLQRGGNLLGLLPCIRECRDPLGHSGIETGHGTAQRIGDVSEFGELLSMLCLERGASLIGNNASADSLCTCRGQRRLCAFELLCLCADLLGQACDPSLLVKSLQFTVLAAILPNVCAISI